MTKTLNGKVDGKIIEFDEDLGVAEGQEVEVIPFTRQNRPRRPSARGWPRSMQSSASGTTQVTPTPQNVTMSINRERVEVIPCARRTFLPRDGLEQKLPAIVDVAGEGLTGHRPELPRADTRNLSLLFPP
jgi:hypothetical protein